VTVTDAGRGMSAADLERISRRSSGSVRSGLASRGPDRPAAGQVACRSHAWPAYRTSVPDEGSQFTITLPRAPDMETADTASSTTADTESTDSESTDSESTDSESTEPLPHLRPARSGEELLVLYVEDNPANVEVVARYLRGNPVLRLASCPTGQQGSTTLLPTTPTSSCSTCTCRTGTASRHSPNSSPTR